jgi:hypothetical protein
MRFKRWLCGFAIYPMSMMFSSLAYASCPPILPCKVTAEASTIAGSNADRELISFNQNVIKSTTDVANAIIDMANTNAKSLAGASQQIIAANAQITQSQIDRDLKAKKAFSDREMAHKQSLAAQQYRASTSIVSPDDTKEEFQLILNNLSKYSDKSVPEIILLLQQSFDDSEEDGLILVRLPSSEGICTDDDVNKEGKCAIASRVFPGKKLNVLFKQCSVNKRMYVEMQAKKEARVAAASMSNTSTARALESTDAVGAATVRQERQRTLSCTPSEFQAGMCPSVASVEEYQEDIIIGNIIPNGDVSASNFNSPTASSAEGFIQDLPDDVVAQIENQSLDREGLIADPNQRIVPLVHTYRNANQVKASYDFINNLIAEDLVPAVSPNDRRKVSNAEYQSRYLNRIAALSMARLIMTESMTQRVGTKMREMILETDLSAVGKFEIAPGSSDGKESVLGASPLDILSDRVNQQAANLQTPDQNGGSSNAGNDFISSPSSNDAMGKISDSLQLQSEMMMKQYLMNEQMMSIEAITLAQMVNSAEMSKLMSELRRKR